MHNDDELGYLSHVDHTLTVPSASQYSVKGVPDPGSPVLAVIIPLPFGLISIDVIAFLCTASGLLLSGLPFS
jgi:hypothetical protein